MWRDGRAIMPHQQIHYSAAFYPETYKPNATPPSYVSWADIVGVALDHRDDISWATKRPDLWEIDVIDDAMAANIVGRLQQGEEADRDFVLHRLKLMTESRKTLHLFYRIYR